MTLRAAWIEQPAGLVFDERYYVNAARTILGTPVPPGQAYSGSSPGVDPNTEHPPLGKLAIAGSIRALGDRPLGWRAPSLVAGSVALLALYALVRGAGASRWTGVSAAALLAADNLFLVHGRIATLDAMMLALMLAAAATFVSRRPVAAGVLVGAAGCTKLVGLLVLPALIAFALGRALLARAGAHDDAEVLEPETDQAGPEAPIRHDRRRRLAAQARPLAALSLAGVFSFFALLAALDSRLTTFSGPFEHMAHMIGFSGHLSGGTSPVPGVEFAPTSRPWEWLVNREPIIYFQRVTPPGEPPASLILFQARMNPFLIFPAVPVLILVGRRAWHEGHEAAMLAVAWVGVVFAGIALASVNRAGSYLFYMLAVLPGVCIALSSYLARRPAWVRAAYGVAVLVGLWVLYPFRTWAGA